LLPQGEVFQDEILAGTESNKNPAEEMPEGHDHDKNPIGTTPI